MAKKKTIKKTVKRVYPKEILEPVEGALKEKLSALEKRRKQVAAEDPFNDKNRLDDNAAIDADAAETVGHMEVSAIQRALTFSIVQVRKALTMIKVGSYGLCERCGKMIDTDRLMIMPETTLCVECEKKREK